MAKLENKQLVGKIAIIGAGNMGKAVGLGLLKNKLIREKDLILTNSNSDNKKAIKTASIVILAVKPQKMKEVISQIKDSLVDNSLVISIAAGVEISSIKRIIGNHQPVVRVMPNLCATVGKSISGWVKSSEVSKQQAGLVRKILQSIGEEILLEKEFLLDAVTAISGSGPAYVFYLVEILEQAAIKIGLDKETARRLAEKTVIGSAYLLENTDKSASILRSEVTSKGGTTAAAFKVFAKLGLNKVFLRGVKAAFNRAKQLHLK